MISTSDRFNRRISQASLTYYTKPVPHGRHFRFDDTVVTVYDNGRILFQGAEPTKAIKRAIMDAQGKACSSAAMAKQESSAPQGIFE